MSKDPQPGDFIKDRSEYRTTIEIDVSFDAVDDLVQMEHSELMYSLLEVVSDLYGLELSAETRDVSTGETVAETSINWASSPQEHR